ncbi:hypothetical protein [Streptomyces mirabilis]|uniref:hypothetical protein n=1 Tax=Streptomyces mirabilis TaxID=68239 RepID=UPI0022580091|nr:hypothetical protein [Streptomyces mirabilis]MCX4429597.1 hypothetical protein [Streptomyces mirabilis]
MTETSPHTDPTPDPPHPYTPAAIARLMLSEAHRDAAETALNRIGTEGDSSDTIAPGDFVREAAELIRLAEAAQRRAVIYERERGTSWEEIGEALGISRQSAHTKFAEYVKAWREPLDKPERLHPDGTPDDRRIPYGARYAPGSAAPANGSAEKTARLLDHWLRRHDGWADQEHPVSGGLPRHSTIEMVLIVGRAADRMRRDQLVPDLQAEADLWDLSADLQERMLRESERGGDPLPQGFHQSLASDRARAKALRAAPDYGSVAWDEVLNARHAARTATQTEGAE